MSPDSFDVPEIELIAALFPAFEFEHLIASGRTGAVFKARHLSLERDVAIKIFPREPDADPGFRNAFDAAAKAMARLAHPNLIRVYDSGDLDGMPYIVMEYVPGKSLHHSAHGRMIDPKQAVEIIIAACAGLANAQANGVIHRDLTPSNILLTPKCEPKIGHFIAARDHRTDADIPAAGTTAYTAPEAMGNPGEATPQSVVFSLGVILREMLTGVSAEAWDTAKAAVPDLGLAVICRNATQPDPALRYPDVATFAAGLVRWMNAANRAPVAARRPTAIHPVKHVALVTRGNSSGWTILKNCAVIGMLLFAIHFTWGILQMKQDRIAREQHEESAKPKIIIVKAESIDQARMSRSPMDSMEPAIARREN